MFDIANTACDLKLGMPDAYERFVEAFKRLEERCRLDFYAADASGIMGAQGRANLASNIRTKLETCLQVRSRT